jgi:hypothetical protein
VELVSEEPLPPAETLVSARSLVEEGRPKNATFGKKLCSPQAYTHVNMSSINEYTTQRLPRLSPALKRAVACSATARLADEFLNKGE